MTAKKSDRTRLKTIFALHAAATAAPSMTLEHVTADGTTEVTSVEFWLGAVPSDRRARPRFSAVAANIKGIANNALLQKATRRNARAPTPDPQPDAKRAPP